MNLPTEVRYRPYADWTDEEKTKIRENVAKSPWRASYHIEPETGLLNDPNGFSYFNGKFQLFYQSWPFGAAHGLKQWVHTETEDLVHFTETGVKLLPDHENDSHGAYSGSAYQIGDKLFIFYTGNVRDENWIRDPRQIGAWMDKDGKIEKFDKVLIKQPADATGHFRDPQIFDYKGQFYAIVGAQNHDKQGYIKLFFFIAHKVSIKLNLTTVTSTLTLIRFSKISTQKNLPLLMAHQSSTWTTDLKLMQRKALTLQMVVPLLLAGLVFQTWTIQLTNMTTKVL